MARGKGKRRSKGPTRSSGRETSGSEDYAEVRRSRLRVFGVALVCANVALVPVVFDQASDVPFVVPKAILSHGIAYLMFAVIAGLCVRFGRQVIPWTWLHVPVLAFLAANVVATAFAADRLLALYGTHARMLGLGTIVDWVVLYFGVVILVRTRLDATASVVSALGSSAVTLVYEFAQFVGRDPFTWATDSSSRPFSTLGQATSLAEYLTALAVGSFALGVLAPRVRWPARSALILYPVALLLGVGATATRSAVVGLVAGIAVVVIAIWVAHPSRRARFISVAGAAAAAGILAGIVVLTPLGARLAATARLTSSDDSAADVLAQFEPSSDARFAIYQVALEMVRERPLFGYGPDNFIVGVPKYRTDREPFELRASLASSAHGWLTQFAATCGLIGLTAFIAIVLGALILTLQTGLRPFAVVGAAVMAAFLGTGLTTVNETGTDWIFWLAVGTIASTTARPSAVVSEEIPVVRRDRTSRTGDPRRAIPLVCVAIGLALAVTSGSAADAARSNRSGQLARVQGRSSQAVDWALRSTRSDPGRAEYWQGLGLAYIATSRWSDASAALERAVNLAPYDVRYIGDLARIQILLDTAGDSGARARAIDLAEQAVRTDPNNPRANLTRAVVMQVTGNPGEARTSIQRVFALDPRPADVDTYVTAAQISLAAGYPSEAVRIARDGIPFASSPAKAVPLRIELARALVVVGQLREALIELDAVLAIQPGQPNAQQLRAEVVARLSSNPTAP